MEQRPDGETTNTAELGADRREILQMLAAGASGALTFGAGGAWAAAGATPGDAADLLRAFRDPPPEARPGVYWYWVGANVTREGITADLEAMRHAGISTVVMFSIGPKSKDTVIEPAAEALTPYWWSLVEHAERECRRLELTLGMNICDGWATASGPWITPELSQQHVVWADTVVDGGRRVREPAPQPPRTMDYYRDIRTVAYPTPQDWTADSQKGRARLTSNLPVSDFAKLADAANVEDATIDTDKAGWVQFDFPRPFTLRSVTVSTPNASGYAPGIWRAPNSLFVEASDDGRTFRRIGRLEFPQHGWQTDMKVLTHAVPETRARAFRLVHVPQPKPPYQENYDFGEETRLKLSSLVLSGAPRIDNLPVKTGEQWGLSHRTTEAEAPASACLKPNQIIDLTGHVNAQGQLDWDAPPGRWTVLRVGYTTTGKTNSAAGAAQGLECDKFSPQAARLQFDRWFAQALGKVGKGGALRQVHVDSWEAGTQNWSPTFAAEFRKRRGYDLLAYLPVMCGVPVESADVSERVLLDVRRTINDLIQDNFFAVVHRLAKDNGCILSLEPANPTFPSDGLQYASHADLPMGEFWHTSPRNDKPTDIKDAVSGGHVYGKRVIGAESFTDVMIDWTETPLNFKALGDHNWCEGINRFLLHVWTQQPWVDRAPGTTLNGIGTLFSRTQTWWKPGQAWFAYVRRAQALLQSGRSVADLAYFAGENIPARALLPDQLPRSLPPGYAYDTVNRDALLHLATVRDGRIVLPSGASYRVLVLPDDRLMTPELASKLRDLVRAGAVVVGPKPHASPSLEHGPAADIQVRKVAAELWGPGDQPVSGGRTIGAGRVYWGGDLGSILAEISLQPALRVQAPAGSKVQWIHRAGRNWDGWFISNQGDGPVDFEIDARVSGRAPQLVRPDLGTVEDVASWKAHAGRTRVPISLAKADSVFVLFAGPGAAGDPVTEIEGPDGLQIIAGPGGRPQAVASHRGRWRVQQRSGRVTPVRVAGVLPDTELNGPWQVTFADRLRAPKTVRLLPLSSWSEQSDPDIRFYSGTAIYRLKFDVPPGLLQPNLRLELLLGRVADLAEVRLNDRNLGVAWKPPFSLDCTGALRDDGNLLEIEVTNTWRNRIIGDHGKPQDQRVTTVWPMKRGDKDWLPGGPGTELSPAGLLGPVRLRASQIIDLA